MVPLWRQRASCDEEKLVIWDYHEFLLIVIVSQLKDFSPISQFFPDFTIFPLISRFFFKFQVVPLWRQRAGRDEEKLVIWDYHVIFISKPDERCLVFDLDSDLPFPTYFHKYVTETFRTDAILNPEYHRFFRVIPAQEFLQTFASDRRHMKKPDGAWMKPPPPYPCIMPTR